MGHAIIIVAFVPHRPGLCLKYGWSEVNGKAKGKSEKKDRFAPSRIYLSPFALKLFSSSSF